MTDKQRIKSEQAIIRTSLVSKDAFTQLIGKNFGKDSFNYPYHRILFGYILDIYYNTGSMPTVKKFSEHLVRVNAEASLKEYCQQEILKSEDTSAVDLHVEAVINDNIMREVNAELDSFKQLNLAGIEYLHALSEASSDLISKYQTGSSDDVVTNKQTGQVVLGNIEKAMSGTQQDYIPTGFASLDKCIVGIPKKNLTIIASRPGMGKTQFMLQLMRNFRKQGVRCGIFSLEMDKESLWYRNLAAETNIDSMKIETGDLTADEFKRVKCAIAGLSTEDYILDDNGRQTPESIKAKINLWKANGRVDVVIVDYLTLIDHKFDEKRNDLNIGKLTAELRIFAKQSGIPIILLSQLNRAVDARPDKRPQLSDLRESGSIEQDAKLVMFLYRPDYYGIDPFRGGSIPYADSNGYSLKIEEYTEVIIRKARSGRVGTVPFRGILPLHKFEEVKLIGGNEEYNSENSSLGQAQDTTEEFDI